MVVRRRRAARASRVGWPRRGRYTAASPEASLAARGNGIVSPIRPSLLIFCHSVSRMFHPLLVFRHVSSLPSFRQNFVMKKDRKDFGIIFPVRECSRSSPAPRLIVITVPCVAQISCLRRWATEQTLHMLGLECRKKVLFTRYECRYISLHARAEMNEFSSLGKC